MAKKPSETSAPEASAAQKPATWKTAARKAAAPAKKTAAKAEEKPADAASVEAPVNQNQNGQIRCENRSQDENRESRQKDGCQGVPGC